MEGGESTKKEVSMLRVTDDDGRQYVFDDAQKEFVKRLVNQNIEMCCRIFELETDLDIAQTKLRKSQQIPHEIVNATIAYLDS